MFKRIKIFPLLIRIKIFPLLIRIKIFSILIILLSACNDCEPFERTDDHEHEVKAGWNLEFSKKICEMSTNLLEFKDFKELEEVANLVQIANEEDRMKIYMKYMYYRDPNYDKLSSYNFPSQYILHKEATILIGRAKDNTQKEQLRLRYSYFFLYNSDLQDEKPYLPMHNKNHAYVANVYGRVIIGGIEYNLNNCNSFDELSEY